MMTFANNKEAFFRGTWDREDTIKAKTKILNTSNNDSISNGVVLEKEKIREKIDQIPVFKEIFGYLKTKGKAITADAMYCQKEICGRAIEKKCDVFGLKENQKSLYKDGEK